MNQVEMKCLVLGAVISAIVGLSLFQIQKVESNSLQKVGYYTRIATKNDVVYRT